MTHERLQHLLDIADRYTVGSSTWNATFTAPVVRELIRTAILDDGSLQKRIDDYLDKALPKDPRPTALPEVIKKS